MHCPWARKTRAWGYEVVRGIDEDDPLRVIRAFRFPTGLAFVDVNSQVEIDYGGYTWTQWMHEHFGDTALHIALKWKRHRAVKALLSLRPDWTIRNEAGVTSEQLVLRVYGKGMREFKDEQEREYENDAMQAEEDAMRRLLAAERAARERDRLNFLQELYAARTLGVEHEAAILLEHGRVILPREVVVGRACSSVHDPAAAAANGWVSHVCRELRRNRFAAQRGAMRRNVVPALSPRPTTAVGSGGATGARAGASSFSPPPTTAGSVRSRAGTKKTSSGNCHRSPISANGVRASSRQRKTRARGPFPTQSNAAGGGEKKVGQEEEGEEEQGGDLFFDSSSAVGSGRWPCADDAGRGRRRSPTRSASPPRGLRRETPSRERGRNATPSAADDDGASVRSGSMWGGSGKASTSPARFDRSSRMSTMRTTHILAAGKSLQRSTPEGRLQRKMAARSAARTQQSQRLPAPTTTRPALTASPRSPLRPAPLIVTRQNAHPAASGGGSIAAAPVGGSTAANGGSSSSSCAVSRQESSAGKTQGGAAAVDHGGASEAATNSRADGGRVGATIFQGSSAGATVGSGLAETRRSRTPPPTTAFEVPAELAAQPPGKASDVPDATSRGKGKSGDRGSGGGVGARPPSPQVGCARPRDGSQCRLSRPVTPGSSDDGAEDDALREVREGPVRDALAALLTSTVMAEDGGRVPAPSFSSVSALRELKYCGPMELLQASALKRVLFARPGVLVRLSLPGKRIGDGGAAAIAPAIAGIRSVDLRSNNIGDDGTVAIASALREAAAAAALAATAATATTRAAGSRGGERGEREKSLCILENLSLAGNRIGDSGAAALGRLLEGKDEEGVEERKCSTSGHGREEERGGTSSAQSPERMRYLGWLSVAANPAISIGGKERLLRAGSNRRRLRASGRGGDENDPPPMVIVV